MRGEIFFIEELCSPDQLLSHILLLPQDGECYQLESRGPCLDHELLAISPHSLQPQCLIDKSKVGSECLTADGSPQCSRSKEFMTWYQEMPAQSSVELLTASNFLSVKWSRMENVEKHSEEDHWRGKETSTFTWGIQNLPDIFRGLILSGERINPNFHIELLAIIRDLTHQMLPTRK